jgi:hypothetical protein
MGAPHNAAVVMCYVTDMMHCPHQLQQPLLVGMEQVVKGLVI